MRSSGFGSGKATAGHLLALRSMCWLTASDESSMAALAAEAAKLPLGDAKIAVRVGAGPHGLLFRA